MQLPVWTTLIITLLVGCYATYLVPLGLPPLVKIGFPALGAAEHSRPTVPPSRGAFIGYVVHGTSRDRADETALPCMVSSAWRADGASDRC